MEMKQFCKYASLTATLWPYYNERLFSVEQLIKPLHLLVFVSRNVTNSLLYSNFRTSIRFSNILIIVCTLLLYKGIPYLLIKTSQSVPHTKLKIEILILTNGNK